MVRKLTSKEKVIWESFGFDFNVDLPTDYSIRITVIKDQSNKLEEIIESFVNDKLSVDNSRIKFNHSKHKFEITRTYGDEKETLSFSPNYDIFCMEYTENKIEYVRYTYTFESCNPFVIAKVCTDVMDAVYYLNEMYSYNLKGDKLDNLNFTQYSVVNLKKEIVIDEFILDDSLDFMVKSFEFDRNSMIVRYKLTCLTPGIYYNLTIIASGNQLRRREKIIKDNLN